MQTGDTVQIYVAVQILSLFCACVDNLVPRASYHHIGRAVKLTNRPKIHSLL